MPAKTRRDSISSAALTKWAIVVLTTKGFTVWRQNNLSVPGRKFIGLKGVPDVIGYDRDGRAVYCEVKAGGDRLSEAQIDFMTSASKSGCRTFICRDRAGAMSLENWADYVMTISHRIKNDPGGGDQ